ncbi:histidinol dehydrogenase, partial [Mesorhizobium sp. M00.F.Ca.ET.220.01.1.1]
MIRTFKPAKGNVADDGQPAVTATVQALLAQIEKGGDKAVRELAVRFDKFDRDDYRLTKAEIDGCINALTKREREDLDFAQDQVRRFAEAQRETILDLEIETLPGVVLGHKNVPIQNVGCYVPGGKYPLLASAHMTVLTARVAGCERVITCAPPFQGKIAEKIVAAQALAGADEIYCLGGVQAIAAMAYGTETIAPVDILAGPGNAYVAEAKRLLFGKVGIDLFAGPTETLVIADDSVDGEIVATDLLGQAEHGVNSPALLITNSEKLARDTLDEIERLLKILPTAAVAAKAWEDFGEIILC